MTVYVDTTGHQDPLPEGFKLPATREELYPVILMYIAQATAILTLYPDLDEKIQKRVIRCAIRSLWKAKSHLDRSRAPDQIRALANTSKTAYQSKLSTYENFACEVRRLGIDHRREQAARQKTLQARHAIGVVMEHHRLRHPPTRA